MIRTVAVVAVVALVTAVVMAAIVVKHGSTPVNPEHEQVEVIELPEIVIYGDAGAIDR